MKPNGLVRAFSFLVLASAALHAQVARQGNVIPLKNWPAPLYWQPSQTERAVPGRATPDLQFSANAVSTTALTFVAITPCRLVDTRGAAAGFNGIAPFSGPSIASAGTLTFPVQSTAEATGNTTPAPCGVIPTFAQGYSLNVTVVPHAPGAVDYISIWPAGGTQPFVATLDDPQGAIVSNAAIVPAGTPTGGISVYNAGPSTTDVIIDMNGYFAAPTDVNGNTAIGAATLSGNTSGIENTATGDFALQSNTTGNYNTASGYGALNSNTAGTFNTAVGAFTLENNTASRNIAIGYSALQANTTGTENMASGNSSLLNNTVGSENTASGLYSLESNTTGSFNTADGLSALGNNTTGASNIAVGYQAALNVSAGNSNNIHIGSLGAAGDSATIKIGTVGTQTSTFIAGISGASTAGGVSVLVNANGQLGTVLSSRRFKEQITGMGDTSSKLLELRPVNFFYKPPYDDGTHLLQYGLIAEEVAKVYPEMVAYDNDGQILTVKYQMLAPMLLNEVQKQNAHIVQLQDQVQLQQEQNRKLEDRLAAVESLLSGQNPAESKPAGDQ